MFETNQNKIIFRCRNVIGAEYEISSEPQINFLILDIIL